MKISINSIRSFNKRYKTAEDIMPDGIDALVTKIGAQLGAIEDSTDIGSKYDGVVVARVVSCYKLEDSDHLNVCRIDDGGKVQDVERSDDGHVQVVCGAPNVREGLTVAWLPPGTTVPESVGKEPFVLEAREIRGVKSNGMLASPRELALGDSHEGILEIDKELNPGDSFAEAFDLKDDVVLDIENKMFTHRPDCFGFLGISRELAGIQGMPFKSPDWYKAVQTFPEVEGQALSIGVRNEIPELVPRFTAIAMSEVKVGPSPVWLQIELAKVGLRSINNIVDYTNFFMLETGQPLHAYDYDKLKAVDGGSKPTIVVRHPHDGEEITLLNGKEVTPRSEAIMIAAGDKSIGIGGIMGGAETEVDESTTRIVLEAATFDMYSIRRTSMEHGLFTDAVTRFNKGQSPLQNLAVLAKIVDEIRNHAGGKVSSDVLDLNRLKDRSWVFPPVPVSRDFINARLGVSLSAEDMEKLLENVEFDVEVVGESLTVTTPFWRTDIETREDVVEEVGRLYGYDKLPLELPKRSIKPAQKNPLLESKQSIRERLATAGANEVLSYSFVHGDLFEKTGQDKSLAFQLSNALSPDLQYYRTALTPSLLDKVHMNIKAGFNAFALFELGKVHYIGEMDADEPDVPNEDNHVALVLAYDDKRQPAGAPYYHARTYLERIIDLTSITLVPLKDFDLAKDEWGRQLTAPYEPGRAAVIVKDDKIWGVVGEFKASVRRALKLPVFSAGFEVHMDVIGAEDLAYKALPRFPKVTQDITFKVPAGLSYQDLINFFWGEYQDQNPQDVQSTLTALDIYKPEGDFKNITLRFTIASYQRTLTDAEVGKLFDIIAAAAHDKFGAERI